MYLKDVLKMYLRDVVLYGFSVLTFTLDTLYSDGWLFATYVLDRLRKDGEGRVMSIESTKKETKQECFMMTISKRDILLASITSVERKSSFCLIWLN